MPAIQPEQLQRQIDQLLGSVADPTEFIRSCMHLLDYYADRTKRPRGSAAKLEIAKILRVPRPVMKMICARIRQFESGEPEHWLIIAQGLWKKAIRESRQVAACALEKSPHEEITTVVEDWAMICEDDQALGYVTSTGLKHWRKQDLKRFYHIMQIWLGDNRLRIRHLAVLAIMGRSEDEDFQELHQVLNLLAGLTAQLRGSSQRSLTILVRQLASLSPPEVAKYLIDELQEDVPGAQRLTQNVLASFPERFQHEIRHSLG
jgi:hypothetical protein